MSLDDWSQVRGVVDKVEASGHGDAIDQASAGFGYSVSTNGDTAVVGAPFEDTAPGGIDAGAVYVFVRSGTTWVPQQRLLAADGGIADRFGIEVSLSGDTIVVGAPSATAPGGVETGAAYVFVRSGTTWTEQQKLQSSDAAAGDRFGISASVAGDTAVVGAALDDTPAGSDAGSAYAFVRSGTTWTEQQKVVAANAAAADHLGSTVSISGDTLVVGAPADDTPIGSDAGSAYAFVRTGTVWAQQQQLQPQAEADLGVTKSDFQTTAVPGELLAYTIVVSNAGPDAVAGAAVTDTVPAALLGAAWTCEASTGSSCTPNGSGNINDTVNLATDGTATYELVGTVAPDASGTLSNTASVTPPNGVVDPNPANNSATDVDALTPEADLAITKTDAPDPVASGDPLTYTLSVTNAGPSDATVVTVTDTLPAGVTFVSSSPGPPVCILAGITVTCQIGSLLAGAVTSISLDVTVNATGGVLVNTATVSATSMDPEPANNAAVAQTGVGHKDGELAHGSSDLYDLSAQGGSASGDVFRISQKPYSSYEVVVDATSGDIGVTAGPFLERIAADGTTVLQDSMPIGIGPSRSLRWRNATRSSIEDQMIRVRSASCATDCGPDDVYRIRTYDTTYSVPRFNNSGSQLTVLLLQNPTDHTISGDVYFWIYYGPQVAVHHFSLGPKGLLALNTASVPGANGASGSITIAHDGRYGDLSGKTVALEPATGFSIDSPMEPRLK